MARNAAKPAKTSLAQVRIIGGEYRRRLVSFVDADGLRPTPDRLRETLFNWLDPYLPNARVLDCCAGSGVLGFEAISRGAAHVSFIEANRWQYQQLAITADLLKIPAHKYTLYQGFAEQILVSTMPQNTAFNLVFLDPPYALDLWMPLLHSLKHQGLLQHNSLIYIEANREIIELTELGWLESIKHTKIGHIVAGLYQATIT